MFGFLFCLQLVKLSSQYDGKLGFPSFQKEVKAGSERVRLEDEEEGKQKISCLLSSTSL